jgi:Trypsin-like peptidase domain/Tetratricopeptide Repeats-Sensor
MGPNDYLAELSSALDEYRFRDVRALTDRIDPSLFAPNQIKKALGLIRRKRLFAELEHAATLFQMAGHGAPVVRRQWAQSLLDQNRVAQALAALKSMSAECSGDPVEGPEIRGLIGRAYKQRYVNEGGAENLREAIAAYQGDWENRRGDYRWQGINVVALLSRARRDSVDTGQALDPARIAQSILDDIDEQGTRGTWDYATGVEASVALGDQRAALDWAKKYVQHPDTDAFELASTLRQLKEVWSLEGTPIGNQLLPVLEYALLQRKDGSVEPARLEKAPSHTGFEAVWGPEGIVYLQWIDTLYGCCSGIARVSDSASGAPKGTGFLVPGTSVHPGWGDAPVFLTNSHVISINPADEAPLRPQEAAAEFTRLTGRPKVALGELLFSSPRTEMDVSILRIDAPPGSRTLELNPYLPTVSTDPKDPQRIYVMGHPGGNELAVSLYDNSLAEYEKQFVRYRSPTEGGNSGSPVFTRNLKCFAIHHRALYEKQLNEGIVLNTVNAAIQQVPATVR